MVDVNVAIWVLQDPSSPRAKVYAAGAWVDPDSGDAVFYSAYGQYSQLNNMTLQVRDESEASRSPIPRSASRIASEFTARLLLKEQRGYSAVLASPRLLTVNTSYIDPVDFMREQALNASNGEGVPDTADSVVAVALSQANTPLASPVPAAGVGGSAAPAPPTLTSTAPAAVTLPDGTDYYPRMVGQVTDIDLLRTARTVLRKPIGLYGSPGTGKTSLPVAAFGAELLTVQGHGELKASDLVGQYIPTPAGQVSASGFTWIDGPLLTAMKEGRPLLVDELTRIPAETLAVLFAPMDFRRSITVDALGGQVVTAAEGFFIIGSWNPDGVGVTAVDDALLRRFPIRIEVGNDYSAAARRGVAARLVRIGQNLATVRAQQIIDGDLPVWTPPVATLLDAQTMIDAGFGDQFVADLLLTACPEVDRDDMVVRAISTALGVTPNVLALGASA